MVFIIVIGLNCKGGEDPPTVTSTGKVLNGRTGMGISGVSITVEASEVRSTQTNENGIYTLTGMVKGADYTIMANAQGGLTNYGHSSTEYANASEGESVSDILLKEITGRLSGRVFNERTGEPLAQVNVVAVGADYSEAQISDTHGLYIFENLPEGLYDVNFSRVGFHPDKSKKMVGHNNSSPLEMQLRPINPIVVTPTELEMGSALTSDVIRITNEIDEEIYYEIEEAEEWIIPEKRDGRVPGQNADQIGIRVDRSKIQVERTSGEIVINVPGRGNRSVTVNIEKLDEAEAILTIEEGFVDFGSATIERELIVMNTGDQYLDWNVSDNFPWLSVLPERDVIAPRDQQKVVIMVDRTGLIPDLYRGRLDFRSNGGDVAVDITMKVLDMDSDLPDELIVTGGLISYFNFENNSFSDVLGLVSTTNKGVSLDGDTPSGKGQSARFSTEGTYLQLSANPLFNETKGNIYGTLCMWVKTDDSGSLFSIPYASSDVNNEFAVGFSQAKLRHSIKNHTSRDNSSSTRWGEFDLNVNSTLLDSRWHLLTLTYHGNNGLVKLFVDGVNRDSDNYEILEALNATSARIGDDFFPSAGSSVGLRTFVGRIDNVRLYNRPLSQSEITHIFEARQ